MKNILARGGIEFLAVFLGIGLSLYVDEWREESQIKERLMADYQSIQNDLEKDIPYLEKIIIEQQNRYDSGEAMLQILDGKQSFDYHQLVNKKKMVGSGATFFGTKSAYDASVSSGRLTYFGNDSLANEIGKVYEHHYNRLDLNGQLLDEYYILRLPDFNTGDDYLSEKVKKQNLRIINSSQFYSDIARFLLLQDSYINKANWALEQMEKVNELLKEKLRESN